MARVCIDWFPMGSYPRQREPGLYMDDRLKAAIDILLINIVRDWFFTILISGGGKVRVGKSVLGMQIACYWSYEMEKRNGIKVPWDLKQNLVFHASTLIEQGMALPKYSALVYDEAGEALESVKVLKTVTKKVNDFLREAGQLNLLSILILPEYFDLPKGIALTRSQILIDVDYTIDGKTGIFQRGKFKFYSEKNKKLLYLKGKKELNYKAHKSDWQFPGEFYNVYTVDEKVYRKMKQEALASRKDMDVDEKIVFKERNAMWWYCRTQLKMQSKQIAEVTEQLTGIYPSKQKINSAIKEFSLGNEGNSVK